MLFVNYFARRRQSRFTKGPTVTLARTMIDSRDNYRLYSCPQAVASGAADRVACNRGNRWILN